MLVTISFSKFLLSMDGHFCCGKIVHKMRDFPMMKVQETKGNMLL